MKFLFHFYDLRKRAGIQRAICELSNALVEQGHEVVIASQSCRSEAAYGLDERVTVIQTPYPEYERTGLRAWPIKVLWAVRQMRVLKELIKRYKPSIVVDHGTGLGLVYPFGSLGGVPFVLQRHFPASSFPKGRYLYRILSLLCVSKTVVVLTDTIAADLRTLGYKRVAVIPNVVPADAKFVPYEQDGTRPRMGLLMGRGRTPQKGFDIFLKALAKKKLDGWRFAIVGPGVESDPVLLDLVQAHNLEGQVSLLPATDDPYEYMRRSSCVIMPSRYEAFGLVAIEALAIGRPLIASDVDGLRDLVIPNVNGFLVPPCDIEALSECLVQACNSPEVLQRLARNASSSIARYDRKRIVDNWIELGSSLAPDEILNLTPSIN